jgi:cytochrome b561
MPGHYTRTAVALHWLIAALVLSAVFMGWTMTEMAISPARLKTYNYHKWVGVTVLALAVLRLAWRLTHRPPPLEKMPRWQQLAAHGGHWLLYALLLAVPMAGWVYSNATGFPVVYLGKLPLPNLVGRDRELAALWQNVHVVLATVLVGVVAVHVLAAVQHHFRHKDDTLRRMLRWRS